MRFATVFLLLLCPPASWSNYSAGHRKLATCPDGSSCISDEECDGACRKSGGSCAVNGDCPRNGDKCLVASGSCSSGGGGGGGGGTSGLCSDGQRTCASDADCLFCTKDPDQVCVANSDCNGNGNKCRAGPAGSCAPPPAPTDAPSKTPTGAPSPPTPLPTMAPTDAPSEPPTGAPSPPTIPPTMAPTDAPSKQPTDSPNPPTHSPTNAPTQAPMVGGQCPNGPATYFPGNLGVTLGGGLATSTLLASTGLNGRVLTREGQRVPLNQGSAQSSVNMHSNADGAATVPDDSNSNRYYLVSNSESSSGGVGILHFDATKTPHDVIGYRRTAQNTQTGSRNCGGGRTPWGTWLTSEESGDGLVYEVDPNETGVDYCLSPIVPLQGGNYESNAFWEASDAKYHFYTTNDSGSSYRLTRFIPVDTVDTMLAKNRKLDRLCGAGGNLSYLKLLCTSGCSSSTPSGTYSWATSRSPDSGDQPYPNAEGIDVKGNDLYFVTKGQRRLYIVDLTSNTWTSTGTIQSDSGSTFSPDQVARITGSNSPDDLLYFAEDGSGTQDIHARGTDDNGVYKFFTIVKGYSTTETTGLTFSPDNKYMYFSHQGNSEIWQIWREDGCTFGNGIYLDVNYHETIARYLRS